jgi:hypothetical protein
MSYDADDNDVIMHSIVPYQSKSQSGICVYVCMYEYTYVYIYMIVHVCIYTCIFI